MKFKENHGVQVATAILGPAATSVIFFGFVYGEFFGDTISKYTNWIQPIYVNGHQVLPFERTKPEMLITFLIIAIAIGLIQVVLGLCLGVYNGIKTKHWSHVYEKGGILGFVVGFILLVLGVVFAGLLLGAALWVQALGGLLVFLGLAFAVKGGKLLGLIESISALANIASYLRIMAVGLAGAIFADAVNGIAGAELRDLCLQPEHPRSAS